MSKYNVIKNWVGLESHRTDDFVHWRDRKPVETMNKLRKAYDAIVAAGLSADVEILLDAAYNAGKQDESDSNAGEGL